MMILREIFVWLSLVIIIAGAAYLHPAAGIVSAGLLGAWIAHIYHARKPH